MNRLVAVSLGGSLLALALTSLAGIGCGGSSGGSTPDSGGMDTGGGKDHFVPDTAHDSAKDGGKDSAMESSFPDVMEAGFDAPSVPPGATQVVGVVKAGFASVQLVGITEDDQNVIFFGVDSKMNAGVYAAPIGGGTVSTILATGAATLVISHNVVAAWGGTTNMTTGNTVGPLTVWSMATGAKAGPAMSTAGVFAASPDGTKVVFNTTNAGGTSGNLVGSATDLTGQTTLLSGTATNSTTTMGYFNPVIGFANNSYFVALHQEGTTTTLSSFDSATWTKVDLLANPLATGGWGTSTTGAGAGTLIAAVTSTNALDVIPVAGGAALQVDTGIANVSGGINYYVTSDGSELLYGTTAGQLKVQTLPFVTASPTTVLSSGFNSMIFTFQSAGGGSPDVAISPDNKYLMYSKKAPASGAVDINLVEIATGKTSSLLSTSTGAIFNDPFTMNSGFALYYTSFTSVGASIGAVGDLFAAPVTMPSGAVTVSKNNVWESNYMNSATGTKVVYNDNFKTPMMGNVGTADIKTIDVGSSSPKPTPVMSGADENYYITNDHKTIVFSLIILGTATTAGIYSIQP